VKDDVLYIGEPLVTSSRYEVPLGDPPVAAWPAFEWGVDGARGRSSVRGRWRVQRRAVGKSIKVRGTRGRSNLRHGLGSERGVRILGGSRGSLACIWCGVDGARGRYSVRERGRTIHWCGVGNSIKVRGTIGRFSRGHGLGSERGVRILGRSRSSLASIWWGVDGDRGEAPFVKDDVLSIGAALVTPSRYEEPAGDPLFAMGLGLDPNGENDFLAEAAAA
jgi:hypothetical protein